MSLMRRDPWDITPFREMIGRIFDETVSRLPFPGWGEWKPSVDLIDRGTEFVVKADLPGYSPENLSITVQENSIQISGETREEKEVKEGSYQLKERSFGSFSRSIPLPSAVKTEEARASFKNGVLEVRLPKLEVPKGRTLQIETE